MARNDIPLVRKFPLYWRPSCPREHFGVKGCETITESDTNLSFVLYLLRKAQYMVANTPVSILNFGDGKTPVQVLPF